MSTATQDSCSKTSRVLLANITSRHPALLSDILFKLRDNFTQTGKVRMLSTAGLVWQDWSHFSIN